METGKNVIAQGAEAILYLEEMKMNGVTGHVVVKDRIKKGYRLPEIDSRIRKQRTRHEESLLNRARRAGVDVPKVLEVRENIIVLEYIKGEKVKDAFNNLDESGRSNECELIGKALGKIHSANMAHGDFTTSNMILSDGLLFVIDFGLSKYSEKPEDHAVDLYLLYEALKAAHFEYLNSAWQKILKSYRQQYSQSKEVLKRLEKIEKRRRYKGG